MCCAKERAHSEQSNKNTTKIHILPICKPNQTRVIIQVGLKNFLKKRFFFAFHFVHIPNAKKTIRLQSE